MRRDGRVAEVDRHGFRPDQDLRAAARGGRARRDVGAPGCGSESEHASEASPRATFHTFSIPGPLGGAGSQASD